MRKYIVYELSDRRREVFHIHSHAEESAERQQAEREKHSKGTLVVGYRIESGDKSMVVTLMTLGELSDCLGSLPDGTTADVLGEDLEAGNFETAHLIYPTGSVLELYYTGPVAEGYMSPFAAEKEG